MAAAPKEAMGSPASSSGAPPPPTGQAPPGAGAGLDEEEPELRIHPVAYAGYYFLLFCSHWAGTARFNKMPHPKDEFDPENVRHFLQNRPGHKEDPKFLSGNYRRVDHKALKKLEAERQKKRALREQALADKERASRIAAAEDPEQAGPLSAFAADVGGEAEEDELYENLFVKQIPPYFILFQCLAILGLWIMGAAVFAGGGSEAAFTGRKGGLDTLDPSLYGQTDLRWSNSDCKDLRWEMWRWFTYQFTHVGIMHVGMNMLLCVLMGIPLEGVQGPFRMFLMFNTGVFGGSLAYFLLDGHGAVVGCSGGCYALIGIHFADLLMNWDSKKFKYPTLFMLLFLVAIDVINVLVSQPEGVSHSAHIGGALFGLIIGVLLCKNLVQECYERVIEVEMACIGLGLLVFAFVWLIIQDEGPKNLFQSKPGWCSAFAYRDIPAGSLTPMVLCSYCGVEECVQSLRYRYKDCCPLGQAGCVSEPYYCVEPFAVDEDYCTKYSAVWVALT